MGLPADAWARDELGVLEAKGLKRHLEPLESPQGPRIRVGGREYVNFSSNDYLGLANDEQVKEAAREAVLRHGVGSGASRLIVGDTTAHQSLERAVADFEGAEAALLFNSGYAANVGVLSALLGPGDVVFSDALNHASLIDGCRLAKAAVVVYPHRDVAALEALVAAHPGRRRLVATDAVFSMDGDRAPLHELSGLCRREGLGLLVDEAHATGVLGARGAGLCEALGVRPDVLMGTLSKGLGCVGAYVAGSAALRELLFNKSRSLVFSTAIPPAMCAAAEAALSRVRADPSLRGALWRNISALAAGLRGLGVPAHEDSAIFSVVLGEPERAVEASRRLRALGLLVKPIRPPTVPVGTSRLRIALSAGHSLEDLDRLLGALSEVICLGPIGGEGRGEDKSPQPEAR
ncbi:MAG: 8-amino-7-oxononanoate synthase [Myxococcales bacterium]|nr:8-amino-7-oxononanoate synthase [Myxococcales bacterium]